MLIARLQLDYGALVPEVTGSGARGQNPSKRSTGCLKTRLFNLVSISLVLQVATREAAVSRFVPASFVYSPVRLFAASRLTALPPLVFVVSLESDADLVWRAAIYIRGDLSDRQSFRSYRFIKDCNMKFMMQRTALALAFLGASAGAINVDFTSDGASIP